MEVDRLLEYWPIGQRLAVRASGDGTNNLSYVVDAPTGHYFLRVYQNTADPARVRYEHAILLRLQTAGLSFAVPCPVATRDGETFVAFDADGTPRLAALFSFIPGEHPPRGDVSMTTLCGEALGELDDACSRVEVPPVERPFGRYGEYFLSHPAATDPPGVLERLPLDRPRRERLGLVLRRLAAAVPSFYATLPQQLIHGDFARVNVLVDRDRVTGILDFEFSAPDLRAMDLVTGLFSFVMTAWGTGREWALIDALVAGYRRRAILDRPEIEALPNLLLLREATSLIHRIRRLAQGISSEDEVVNRARDMLDLADWVESHGEELTPRLMAEST